MSTPECRVCLHAETDPPSPLIRPCECRDRVHRSCLRRWRSCAPNASMCQVCHTPFKPSATHRIDWTALSRLSRREAELVAVNAAWLLGIAVAMQLVVHAARAAGPLLVALASQIAGPLCVRALSNMLWILAPINVVGKVLDRLDGLVVLFACMFFIADLCMPVLPTSVVAVGLLCVSVWQVFQKIRVVLEEVEDLG